ncbi:uncharacterized protein [Amphiura filiformis]|uniref:uncharacterized protein n=1 Tax=Amphiura filiformis TaxID=82378 RepID=UPI003B210A62
MDQHSNALLSLCRVCGARRKKWRQQATHNYDKLKHADRLARAYGINVNDDEKLIHPVYVCLSCIAASALGKDPRKTVIVWNEHGEGDTCKACSLMESTLGRKTRKPGKVAAATKAERKKEEDERRKEEDDKIAVDQACNTILGTVIKSPPSLKLQQVATVIMKVLLSMCDPHSPIVELPTGGQKLVFQKISKPRIPSNTASRRTINRRSEIIQKTVETISCSEESKDSVDLQLAAVLRLKSTADLEEFLHKQNLLKIRVPTGQELLMKVRLGWSWAQMRLMKGWLKQYNIVMAAESVTRKQRAAILGSINTLEAEMLPFFFKEEDEYVTKLAPIVYVPNVHDHIMQTLDDLDKYDMLESKEQIWIKIGGDKGGGSTKVYYQILNVAHCPNSRYNSIVFCAYEADENVLNLHLALDRYIAQINSLLTANWQGIPIHVWLCGDFAMDSKLLGLQGASATYPCIACHVTKGDINNTGDFPPRTLTNIKQDHEKVEAANYTRTAKKINHSVSHQPFFDIPLDQVCPPVLHINLGLYNKFYNELVEDVQRLGEVIADELEKPANADDSFTTYVQQRQTINERVRSLQKDARAIRNEATDIEFECLTQSLFGPCEPSSDQMETINLLHEQANHLDQQASDLRNQYKLPESANPLVTEMENSLKSFKVRRQAYHSRTFIGNHVDKCLKEENYTVLLQSIVDVTTRLCPSLQDDSVAIQMKYMVLFQQFSKCYQTYTSTNNLSSEEIDELETDINLLVTLYLQKWRKLTPKFHYLAKHVVPFIRRVGMGLGILSEQGGEQLHNIFNTLARRMAGVRNVQGMEPELYHLKKTMEEHLVLVHPSMRVSLAKEE